MHLLPIEQTVVVPVISLSKPQALFGVSDQILSLGADHATSRYVMTPAVSPDLTGMTRQAKLP